MSIQTYITLLFILGYPLQYVSTKAYYNGSVGLFCSEVRRWNSIADPNQYELTVWPITKEKSCKCSLLGLNNAGEVVGVLNEGQQLFYYSATDRKQVLIDTGGAKIRDAFINNQGIVVAVIELGGRTQGIGTWSKGDVFKRFSTIEASRILIAAVSDLMIAGYHVDKEGNERPLLVTYEGLDVSLDFSGRIQAMNDNSDIGGQIEIDGKQMFFYKSINADDVTLVSLEETYNKEGSVRWVGRNNNSLIQYRDKELTTVILWRSQDASGQSHTLYRFPFTDLSLRSMNQEGIAVGYIGGFGEFFSGLIWNSHSSDCIIIGDDDDLVVCRSITDGGSVVGFSDNHGMFYWSNEEGLLYLNKLLKTDSYFETLYLPVNINTRKQIIGYGRTRTGTEAMFFAELSTK